MAVENVAQFRKVLDNYNANDWVKSIETKEDMGPIGIEESLGPIQKSSFAELLASSVNDVNDLQKEANQAIQKLVTGENKNIHETMLTVEKAEIAFRTMNQIRMKVIDAYKEIMKMQV